METAQSDGTVRKYEPTETDTVEKLANVLKDAPYPGDNVFVQLPGGTYRAVERTRTSDDTIVLELSNIIAEPYEHEDE